MLIQGTQGIGVMIAHTTAEVEGMLDTLWTLGQEILLQGAVAESRGKDVRALVVGDHVVAAMRRTARAGSSARTSTAAASPRRCRSSASSPRSPSRRRGSWGSRSQRDMLEARTGPKISGGELSPGFERLEAATGGTSRRHVSHAMEAATRSSRYGAGHLA